MSEKPQAGEFWEWDGVRLRIVGARMNGSIVAEHECGSLEFGCTVVEMKHLPDCRSFDWQPETPPHVQKSLEMELIEKLQKRVERLEAAERRERAMGDVQ